MAPVNCRKCDRYALVLDKNFHCGVCREDTVSEQLLDFEDRDYRKEHAAVFGTGGESIPSEEWYFLADGKNCLGETLQEYNRRKYSEFTVHADMVNAPPHYTHGSMEVIDVIESYAPNNFHLGCVIKYVCRSGHKGSELEDWKKARWYLDRLITQRELVNDS